MKSTDKSKIYKKDFRKVASYASVSIEDMAQLTQKITELQEDVTKQYPEATDFKVKFEIIDTFIFIPVIPLFKVSISYCH